MSWGAISSIMKKAKADAPPPPAPQPRGQPPKDKNKDKKKWNGEHELVDGVWQGRWEGAEEKEESGEQPEEAARRREQQESWKETLPWLSVEKKKRCAVPGCTGCNLCALKTMDSSNLHDVLRAASRMIAAEERVSGWICDSDEEMDAADTTDSPETGGDGAAAPDGEEDEPSYTAEELLEKVGPYVVPKGWKHVPVTASSPEAWREQLKKYIWKGKRLAHIFEGGWSDASYHKRAEKTQPGFYVFYYKDQGDYLIHNLELSEHGLSKAWVIIEKEPTRARRG